MTSEGVRIHIHQTPELECSPTRLDYLSKENLIGTAQPKGLVSQSQVITLACKAVIICVYVCVHAHVQEGRSGHMIHIRQQGYIPQIGDIR